MASRFRYPRPPFGCGRLSAVSCCFLLGALAVTACSSPAPRRPAEGEGVQAYGAGMKFSRMQADLPTEREEQIVPADEAAAAVEAVPGVNEACVVLHRRQAIAAVALDEPAGEMSGQVRERIEQAVRLSGTPAERIRITAHPGFLKRLQAYTETVRGGRSVPGFNREFPELLREAFPGEGD
ncbi:YhcN/YlaJ family sporulation lipoprotein [Paenibacillus caseinilyticus]|uniref:YhcN/YlaJ family sporulation lipoprotein n=1 Tax=Paenibacillus mucilaginosus TaxID=61624 RepID=UPI0002592619|nr:YhcN/YlaJ family sporulation lipoprotein [Paenibacillus mucilaginosus]